MVEDHQSAGHPRQNIVIVGASTAGLPLAHYILRYVIPSVGGGHLILIDPNVQGTWFQRIGSPRAIISEEALALDKIFLPVPEAFKEHPIDQYTLLQGTAVSLDSKSRNIQVKKDDGSTENVEYYALIIATGAASATPILGVQGSSSLSADAIKAFRTKLPEAKSIVIAGGGPAGVESAGEIGSFLNGQAGWFSSKPANSKAKITLVTSADRLLPVLRPSLGKKAETMLNKVGVDVVYNVKVESTSPENAGRLDAQGGLSTLLEPASVTLSNGETLQADLFIPAWGLTPNTSWLPADLVGANGKVLTNKATLRVEAAGPRVYAVGDVADYGKGGAFELMNANPVAAANIKRDLLAEANASKPSGEDKKFEDKVGESQLVPIGKGGGVGAVFGWQLPSIMVGLIKGRDYLASTYPDTLKGAAFKKDVK